MAAYYFYKLTVDDGGAPCVSDNLLSLAICKPMIRRSASAGDVIFGFAANSLHRDNPLIYIARVTEKLNGPDYYGSPKYAKRGDCIYVLSDGGYKKRPGAKYHGSDEDLLHDLGKAPHFSRAHVLLSTDFRYFGGELTEDYRTKHQNLSKAIAKLGRGHRVNLKPQVVGELSMLMDEVWSSHPKRVCGQPSQAPKGAVSHRGGVCRSVERPEKRLSPLGACTSHRSMPLQARRLPRPLVPPDSFTLKQLAAAVKAVRTERASLPAKAKQARTTRSAGRVRKNIATESSK
jgi:hypothetical protein